MFIRNFLHIYIQGLKFLVLTALIRIACLIVIKDQLSGQPLFSALIMGLRFDWLVLSFILIPVWIVLVAREFTDFPQEWFDNTILYFWRSITGIALTVWFVNSMYFTHQKGWMWISQWKSRLSMEPIVSLLLLCGIFAILFLFRNSLLLFWNIRLKPRLSPKAPRWKDRTLFLTTLTAVIVSALLLLMGGRGTFTAHHLEFQHSRLTSSREINAWILSPLWTINKNP